jgi:hypothetical protein
VRRGSTKAIGSASMSWSEIDELRSDFIFP